MAAGAVFLDSFVEPEVGAAAPDVIFDFYVDTFTAANGSSVPVLALPIGWYEAAGAIFHVKHDRFSAGATKADFDECASRAMLALAMAPSELCTTFEFTKGAVTSGSDEHRRRLYIGFYTMNIAGKNVDVVKLPVGDYAIGHRAFRIASQL